MENKEWLYCFTCGSSHYMTFDASSCMWKCPNCHSFRMKQTEEILKAMDRLSSKLDDTLKFVKNLNDKIEEKNGQA